MNSLANRDQVDFPFGGGPKAAMCHQIAMIRRRAEPALHLVVPKTQKPDA